MSEQEAPADSAPTQEEVLKKHSSIFGEVVKHLLAEDRKEVAALLDSKLSKVNEHIASEDTDRGELLRILAELNGELNLISGELKAYRQDNVAIRAQIDSLTARVDKHGERLASLEKKKVA